jgi:glutathione S-transferase
MAPPDLYVFAISHYCEKARWALEHLGVAYTLRHLAPGRHIQVAQELGAPGTSTPFLVADGAVVQGSSAIIDWGETQSEKRLSPETGLAEECRAIEQRLDDVAGVHVRRFYYSEALVEHPETVQPMLAQGLAPDERAIFDESFEIVRKLMMGRMDLGREQGEESKGIVEGELDWLDDLLADGRRYLVGDRFSRADLTAASLLAPLARPPEHPTYGMIRIPPRAQADLDTWSQRPVIEWMRAMYRDHR